MKHHPLNFFRDYKIQPRRQQEFVLNQLMKFWDKYKYFAFSCPTGTGKTYIATATANSLGSAYILTSTLQLQAQYESSWKEIVNLKGRGNYNCGLNGDFTVDSAPCSVTPDLIQSCKAEKICPYYLQKEKALQAPAMITNPVYMLYSAHCGFAKPDGESDWIKRRVMIIDEAHNIESHLVSFAESDIDPQYYETEFGLTAAKYRFTGKPEDDYLLIVKIKQDLEDKATELKATIDREFPQRTLGLSPRDWAIGLSTKLADKIKKLNAKAYKLDKAIQPIKIFFNNHSTPEELTQRWIISKHEGKNVVKIAPIYGDFLFESYLEPLADKFIFLSATLGSKEQFCKEIGVHPDEMLYLETDSPFDPGISPVIAMPRIQLSRDKLDKNLPKLGAVVDEILNIHPNERGIIHCVNYDLQKEIFNRVSSKHRDRLLCRDMFYLRTGDKFSKRFKNEELLSLHERRGAKSGSVLLSPSMMEGVDLKDDLSRFQIIIKLPWGNLGDLRIRVKSERDPGWYANKMWLSVLQSSGRSTRHEEDHSVTYILDSKFKWFYMQWKNKLPRWFKVRIVFDED